MLIGKGSLFDWIVALFTRAWIEIIALAIIIVLLPSRPLHEGVD